MAVSGTAGDADFSDGDGDDGGLPGALLGDLSLGDSAAAAALRALLT